MISGAVSKLKPKSDVFELQLGLPNEGAFADENGILTQSYQMIVNIIKNKKVVNSYDLNENDIKLNSWDYQDKLEVHEKGPCRKVLNFVDS